MAYTETTPAAEQQTQPETVQISGIPRAVEALESLRDINLSVIYVQLEVGSRLSEQYGVDASAFYISREWWDNNVGHSGTFSEMASSFDNAYKGLVSQRIADITQSEVVVADDAGELSVTAEEAVGSTEETNRSYEMLENLGNALTEAEDNAIAFAKIVGFETDEGYSEAFLVDLVAYVDEKYTLSLSEEDLDKIYEHVKQVLKEQQHEEPEHAKLATVAYDATETVKDGQTFDEYTLERQQAFAQINKGEMPDIDGSQGEVDSTVIAERQALLERYQDFENVDVTRNLVASGLDSDVYAYEQDGQQYIIRAVKDEILAQNPAKTDDYVSALIHGKGIEGLEQIVACSYKDGVIVSERAPGKSLEELLASQPEAVEAIPDEHFEQLLSVFEQM